MRDPLLLLLAIPLFGCPPDRNPGEPPADDDDASADDDDASADDDDAVFEEGGCWGTGPGSDVPFAWGRRGDALVLLAHDGSETVLHEGAADGPMQAWQLLQAGGWMAAYGSWWNTNEDRGTAVALYDSNGDTVASRVVDGVTGWEAFLASDGILTFWGGTAPSGEEITVKINADGSVEETPYGRPAGPAQLGAVPVCQAAQGVCGWLPDGDTELFGALPSGAPFWPSGDRLLRFNGSDPALPAVMLESPWYPSFTFLDDSLPADAPNTAIVATSDDGVAILGQYAGWEVATWLVVDAQQNTAFELDRG